MNPYGETDREHLINELLFLYETARGRAKRLNANLKADQTRVLYHLGQMDAAKDLAIQLGVMHEFEQKRKG